ncbi:hypothetical protein FXW07_06835 [Methanosarcina sp. DH1]|uniref:hypothetical protein n=1 Tax=Methanosarcina sp. DH1 TaxID=2605695 RepID=UPI001E59AEE3|nr:hypothetical protein [Methanosarcina sp. DH1]MCC4766336.1 hypothetical protein [Methanosarcina sp. DH1]
MNAVDFDPHITVENIANVRNPDYCVRAVRLENLRKTIETPFKIISGDDVNCKSLSNYSPYIKNPILESARFVQLPVSWTSLENYLTKLPATQRNNKLRNFFKIDKKLWDDSLTTLSMTFPRNPFEMHEFSNTVFDGLNEDSYIFLLNFIYSNSSAFVLVPDIKIKSDSFVTTYLEIIDFSVKQLSEWNSKPIFVPLQIDLSERNLITILSHYKTRRYSNIWIDFSNHPCDSDFSANLRSIKQLLNRYMQGLDVVLHYSHIKKEINPHLHDTKVAASDILTQFFGADFIGVKRFGGGFNPQGNNSDYLEIQASKNNFGSVDEYQQALKFHSTRLFSPNTYYYHNLDCYPESIEIDTSLLTDKVHNKLVNNMLLYREIETTKAFVEEKAISSSTNNRPLKDYLNKKLMLKENEIIRNSLIPKQVQSTLSDLADLL